MNRIWLVIALLCSIALLNDLLAPYHARTVSSVPAADGGWTVSNRDAAFRFDGGLVVEARAEAVIVVRTSAEAYKSLEPGLHGCTSPSADGVWSCRTAFTLEPHGVVDVNAIEGEVLSATVEIVRVQRVEHIGADAFFWLVALLAGTGLVFRVFATPGRARASVAAAVGAGWVVWAGGTGGLWLLALLTAFYPLLRLQVARPGSIAATASTLAFVIVTFIAVKGNVIALTALFADPGRFSFAVPVGFAFLVIRVTDLALRVATREIATLPFMDYLRYLLFPATFVAGPVQTWPQFHRDILDTVDTVDWTAGLARILVGVAKKLVANVLYALYVAPQLDLVFMASDGPATHDLWLLLVANAIYVYLDFSAYSDIAIGAGRQLGWRVPENFNFPFLRTNMREFWRNWHMSVSGWVMRWVHFFSAFPLRRSPAWAQVTLPVIVSMTVIGLWHQPDLTWFLWGVHHAAGILLAGLAVRQPDSFIMKLGGMGFVLAWVGLAHAFTLVSDPAHAVTLYLRALGIG